MENKNQHQQLIRYWIKNLVGSQNTFMANFLVILLSGFLYTFNIVNLMVLPVFFGFILSSSFIVLIYSSLLHGDSFSKGIGLPDAFQNRKLNSLMMGFDILLIAAFNGIMIGGIFNNFVIRLLNTLIIPLASIVLLRILYIVSTKE